MSLLVGFFTVVIMASVLPLVAVCLAYPYIALRIRDGREEHHDPELGVKSAYYLLYSAAVLLVLFGLTMSAIDLFDGALDKGGRNNQPQQVQGPFGPMNAGKDEFWNTAQRTAWGAVFSGLLFGLTLLLMIKSGTIDSHYPAVKRMFAGGRLGFAGVVVMVTLTAIVIGFFQKEVGDKRYWEVLLAIMLVWAPAFAVHAFLLRLYSGAAYYVESPRSSRRGRDFDLDD
jgi:hypothetical protein